MTLAQLLALLPDNNTGAIDADDLRTITTELWLRSQPTEGVWTTDLGGSSPPAEDPGECASQSGITQFSIANVDLMGRDFRTLLMTPPAYVRIISIGSPSNFIQFVPGTVLDFGAVTILNVASMVNAGTGAGSDAEINGWGPVRILLDTPA